MQLTHIRLLVDNFERCFDFYHDVLELPYRAGTREGPYVEFDTGTCLIALFRRPLMSEALSTTELPYSAHTQDRICLCLTVDDVDQAYDDLSARGAVFDEAPQDREAWMIRTAHLRDPDGNLIEISQSLG